MKASNIQPAKSGQHEHSCIMASSLQQVQQYLSIEGAKTEHNNIQYNSGRGMLQTS